MPTTYERIATTTLSSNASNITFSGISGAYSDLRLIMFVQGAGTDPTLRMRVNSSTLTVYNYTAAIGNGSAASAGRGVNNDYFYTGATTLSLSFPEFYQIDFFNYAASTQKSIITYRSADANGSGNVEVTTGLWRDTPAITSIQLFANLFNANGLFASGTTASLYGILRA